jgi:hypothetical protein
MTKKCIASTADANNAPATESKSRTLTLKPDKKRDRQLSDLVVEGVVGNAVAAIDYSRVLGELSLNDMLASLRSLGETVSGGDMSSLERVLVAQALSLNTMFAELSRRAAVNMGRDSDATDRYLRLALKAQSQSRASIEALAVIKNPPVFARQANIAHGPQQVNNGVPPPQPNQPGPTVAHAREAENTQSKLLDDRHGEWLDTGAQGSASGPDKAVVPVGTINRAAKR